MARVFDGAPMGDAFEFLTHVTKAARMSWGQPGLPQTTYNEIISSGKHSLIRNEELRHRISEHYQFTVEIRERGNARVGDYSKRAYELLPRNSERMDIDAEN